MEIYIPGYYATNRRPIEALLRYPIYIVDSLKAKILIGIDIIIPKDIDLVISSKIGYISSYRTNFKLTITPLIRPFLKRDVLLGAPISIPVRLNIAILINYINLPTRDNFIFKPTPDYLVALFTLLVDSFFYTIIVRNDLDSLIELPRKLYISTVIDLDINRYYYINNPNT